MIGTPLTEASNVGGVGKNRSTENAGPENGGPKKMKELKMQD